MGTALVQHPAHYTLHPQLAEATNTPVTLWQSPSCSPDWSTALPYHPCPSTPAFHHALQKKTSLIYFFSLHCHLTSLYQIFADGASIPNHASQLLHYLGSGGHPVTSIHARKVRDNQKVLLCSCLPACSSHPGFLRTQLPSNRE